MLGAGDYQVLHAEEQLRAVNWKILVEGGIEAYHFRVAHRNTIAPYFFDNLSTYRCFGPHMRSILAEKTLTDLAEQPVDSWRLRDHAQVLYSIFPIKPGANIVRIFNQGLIKGDEGFPVHGLHVLHGSTVESAALESFTNY